MPSPSSKQRYDAASSGSSSDSEDSVTRLSVGRKSSRRMRSQEGRESEEDSVDGLDEARDDEKLVGMQDDVEEEELPRVSRLKRSWVMASLPSSASLPPPYNSAPSSTKSPAPKPSWLSGTRLVYMVITGGVVLAIIVLGSILIAKEYGESAEEHSAESSVSSAYSATGTMPDLALPSTTGVMSRFPELQELMSGNREFRNETEEEHPGLVEELAQGQHPKVAYLGCADSRVPETEVFGADIGDLFVTRNVGNQYMIDDLSAETTVSYAIAHLGVQHVIVMGHYGCGAVQASIASESEEASTDIGEARIDTWIRPIRTLFKTSNHSDIVAFREAHARDKTTAAPNRTEPAFRALVEENVKQQVSNLADDSSVLKSWKAFFGSTSSSAHDSDSSTEQRAVSTATSSASNSTSTHRVKRSSSSGEGPVELWLHGWVYDIDTGLVTDLGVSVGPSGVSGRRE